VKHLWAPWRLQYIKGPATPDCIFCAFPREGRDRDRGILMQGRQAFVILNVYPYNSGHLMVVPHRHVADPADLSDDEHLEMQHLVVASVRALREVYGPEGFNIGMNIGHAAGAGIAGHLHTHVVPRWVGDTNFMPVLGETKVLPEELTVTYDRLAAVLRAVPSPVPPRKDGAAPKP
jgi:ATP adenylyltransferase